MFAGSTDLWHLAKRKPSWALGLLRRPRLLWAVLSGAVFIAVLENPENHNHSWNKATTTHTTIFSNRP